MTRLIDLGPETLTSAELVAILIGIGNNGRCPPSRAAADIIASVDGSLRRLASDYAATLRALHRMHAPATARRKAAIVQAAFELGRRHAEELLPPKPCLETTAAVVALMAPRLRDRRAEEFHTLALDAHCRLERDITVTRGLLDRTDVDARGAFCDALAERAASVIFVHNHPSGDPTPSPEDRTMTAVLVAAGHVLDVPVRDHVIIGYEGHFSFADEGWL